MDVVASADGTTRGPLPPAGSSRRAGIAARKSDIPRWLIATTSDAKVVGVQLRKAVLRSTPTPQRSTSALDKCRRTA